MKDSFKTILEIQDYIRANFELEILECDDSYIKTTECAVFGFESDLGDISALKRRVANNLDDTWHQALFHIIDEKNLDEVEVYKSCGITKQTFSKIRADIDYQPHKDTAISLCFGLKLNLDEALDLLGKAGYTLSKSITRDLTLRYFFEKEEYDLHEIDKYLLSMHFKTLRRYK